MSDDLRDKIAVALAEHQWAKNRKLAQLDLDASWLAFADAVLPLVREAQAEAWRVGHRRGLLDADLQHEADNPYEVQS